MVFIRKAQEADISKIRDIYNEGILDRIATLETDMKSQEYMENWFRNRKAKYVVLVAEKNKNICGWVSLNPYSHRCAYDGVADLSIYIGRDYRGQGIGKALLAAIEEEALSADIHKIVLFTFPFNALGQGLYTSSGYREVGIFKEQGQLDGKYVDVMAMEKILKRKPTHI